MKKAYILLLLFPIAIWSTPAKSTLYLPVNGAIDQSFQPTFTWSKATGATTYKLQVCLQNQWFGTDLIVEQPGLTDQSWYMEQDQLLTLPTYILTPGKTYYWRVVTVASDKTVMESDVRTFTVKTTIDNWPNSWYPIKNLYQISGVFGPRATTTNWFHNGMDVSSMKTQKINVVAPFDCKVVYYQNNSDGSSWIDFVSTEADIGLGPWPVKSFRFQHVVIPPLPFDMGKTFKRGEVVCNGLEMYNGNGYHVHMCAWDYEVPMNTRGTATQSRNPLEYWSCTFGSYVHRSIGPNVGTNEPWPTDPNQANKRYFYFTIAPQKYSYTLNKIVVQVIDANGVNITKDFLDNPDATTLDFNIGTSIDRSATGLIDPIGTVNWYTAIKNGIKIWAVNFDQTQTEKVLTFWYYIKSTAPNPKYFQVDYYDCKNVLRGTITNTLPSTPIGGPPDPVQSLAIGPVTNGLRITWIPPNYPHSSIANYYSVYRKKTGSTESPLLIGSTINKYFEDRTDCPQNTIIPGTTYSYSIAGTNSLGIGSLSSWVNGTMPSIATDVLFENRVITTIEPDLKAKNSITIRSVSAWDIGKKNFISGNVLNINSITVPNGAGISFSIDPTIR